MKKGGAERREEMEKGCVMAVGGWTSLDRYVCSALLYDMA